MNETQQIEKFLQSDLPPEDRLLMEARLLLDNELKMKLFFQQKTYELIHYCGRKDLRNEIQLIEKQMFSDSRFYNFRLQIKNIFKKL